MKTSLTLILRITAASLLLLAFSASSIAQDSAAEQPSDDSVRVKVGKEIFTTRLQPKTLALPAETEAFQFSIYGDRTGGDPSGLKFLRQAVKDTNLIDPDFVMTVGDLIQGYNKTDEWLPEMKEYRDIMKELKMEWFPVAGNHDIYWDFRDRDRPRRHHESNFEKHFGPLWYSFEHKDHGFVVLFSDEGDPKTDEKGFRESRMQNMSPEQLEFLEKALEKLKDCKRVFCFIHHPRWLGGGYQGSNWPEVHKRLVAAGNVGAVFGGHIHHMTFHGPVDGIEYYSLAATGGHLSIDSPELGYLHHFNLVTVRPSGFSVAAVPVGAVIDPKIFEKTFLDDVNVVRAARPKLHGDKLKVTVDGAVNQKYSVTFTNPGVYPLELILAPNVPQGWQAIPDHEHTVIGPGKTESASFFFVRRPDPPSDPGQANASVGAKSDRWGNQQVPKISLNVDYLHPKSRVRLPEFLAPVEMVLAEVPDDMFSVDTNSSLSLSGKTSPSTRRAREVFTTDSARILNSEIDLPQGPFTVEAWVYAENFSKSRAVVAKTQSSEFGLFLHEGYPQFDVHLDGSYVSPKADSKIKLKAWTHLAGVFDGSQCRLYIDGKSVQSLPGTGTRGVNKLPLFVGADPDGYGNPTREFAGQIDEVRLSQGVRYTEDFVPKRRHQADEKTKLLLNFDRQVGPFVLDASENRTSVILLGKAAVLAIPSDN